MRINRKPWPWLIHAFTLVPVFGGAAGALVGPLTETVEDSSDAESARVVLCDSVERLCDDDETDVMPLVFVSVDLRV
jgi:hypothetical protein